MQDLKFSRIDDKQTISEKIIYRITDMIGSGWLKVGDKLPPERELAEILGVGRSSVREALKSLTAMGFLEVHHGEGTFIRQLDSQSVRPYMACGILLQEATISELIEVRQLVEGQIVARAALMSSDQDVEDMEAAIRDMEDHLEQGDDNVVQSEVDFHTALANAAGNRILSYIVEVIKTFLETWFRYVLCEPANVRQTILEHKVILNAIKSRDVERARGAMQNHLEYGYDRLQIALTKYKSQVDESHGG